MAIANVPASSMTQTLVDNIYERMFGDMGQSFDLYEGTVSSPAGAKVIYLSTDIIVGIHKAIEYEAGEAWAIILKSCGRRWGKRVAGSLEKELRSVANRRFDALTVTEYVALLEKYFSHHGWGRLTLRLEGVEQHGVIHAELKDSLFRHALPQVEGAVDHMVAGMLAGVFEQVGQTQLDVLQFNARTDDGVAITHFLISGTERIATGQALADVGEGFDLVFEKIRTI